MGRTSKGNASVLGNESNTPPILEIGFSDPLFSVAAHPTRPIIVSGLGTGHVYCHSYNPDTLEDNLANERANFLSSEKTNRADISSLKKKWWRSEGDHANIVNDNSISVSWKTKRHKGSCRSVLFDISDHEVGDHFFTAGTDNIVKKAKTETGKVQSKIDISSYLGTSPKDSITTLNMSNTHPFLVSGTENGHVLVFDSANLSSGQLKFKVDSVQEDAINKILPMPAVSSYHFLALGSTQLAHIDIRKGIISQSDDQADELLSMCYPTEYVNANKNDTVIVSHGEGVLTLWKNSINGFSDQISRVKVNKNASLDAIISTMNSGDSALANSVWCGDSEGFLHRVDYKRAKVIESRVHSSIMSKAGAVDEVGGLDIDFEYRLVSSGMEGLKIWSGQEFETSENSEDSDSSDDSDSDEDRIPDESGLSASDFYSSSSGADSESEEEEALSNGTTESLRRESTDGLKNSSGEESGSDLLEKNVRDLSHINKRRRFNPSEPIKKFKKENAEQSKSSKKEKEKEHEKKKKDKAVKNGVTNHGIAKFEGL